MGFLRVDMGGRGRWDRILAKCEHDAKSIREDPRFTESLGTGRAELSLAVTLPHKAERLRQVLQDHPLPIPIRIIVIPELLYLIAPPPEPQSATRTFKPPNPGQINSLSFQEQK